LPAYASTSLVSNYATIFPDLVTEKIDTVRIDRIAVWGGTDLEPVYLTVGKFYSRKDVSGVNHRARLCCMLSRDRGQCDENTLIKFQGATHLSISGVVYLKREALPGETAVEVADTVLPVAFSNRIERSAVPTTLPEHSAPVEKGQTLASHGCCERRTV